MIYQYYALAAAAAWIGLAEGFLVQQTPVSSSHQVRFDQEKTTRCRSTILANNEDLQPGIAAINEANPELFQKLSQLRNNPYFRLYSVDILGSCEYMPQELFECYSETCEIYPVGDDEIPQTISSVDAQEYDFDLDGWARWDMPTDDYYDIAAFPEGYTGYDGSEVWNYIHNKICFAEMGFDADHWKADFNKAVSGLHSMISAQVNRGIQERVDNGEAFSDDEVWRDPDAEFNRRLSPTGENPRALENLYFGYMLLLSATLKAKPVLPTGTIAELGVIMEDPIFNDNSISVAVKQLEDHISKDPQSMWEGRMRIREIARVMNCVQCNKCRLHGKISTMGLSTALKVLVEDSSKLSSLHRVELATLVATLHKFSTAVDFCQRKLN